MEYERERKEEDARRTAMITTPAASEIVSRATTRSVCAPAMVLIALCGR
jgi:hypothetical protein